MSIEAIRELETLASVCPELNMANYTEDDVLHLNDWAIEMSLRVERYALSQQPDNAACRSVQKRLAAQQPVTAIACGIPGMAKTTCPYCEQGFAFEYEQPATPESVEDGIRNAEDELNCAEEVLDAITCEFSDGEFPVTDFNCIGDYITAVVDVFKERLAAPQPAQATQAEVTDEQILEVAEPFGAFEYGDAQGDKRIDFARALLALHPQAVPMTEEQAEELAYQAFKDHMEDRNDDMEIDLVRKVEQFHRIGITAQAKKGTP